MPLAQHRLEPPGQQRVGEDRIEINGRFGRRDFVPFVRDRGMQEGQRLGIVQRPHLGHERCQKVQRPVGLRDEG